jgi:hypothetical protein
MRRVGGTPRLYRWLLIIGTVALLAPAMLTYSAASTVAARRERVDGLQQQVDSLDTRRADAEADDDPRLAEYERDLARSTGALERAQQQLTRAQRAQDSLWRLDGRGPVLLFAAILLLLLGYRLRRFEQFGE